MCARCSNRNSINDWTHKSNWIMIESRARNSYHWTKSAHQTEAIPSSMAGLSHISFTNTFQMPSDNSRGRDHRFFTIFSQTFTSKSSHNCSLSWFKSVAAATSSSLDSTVKISAVSVCDVLCGRYNSSREYFVVYTDKTLRKLPKVSLNLLPKLCFSSSM